MFNLNIADLNICVENKYPYIRSLCTEYIVPICPTDFSVSVTEEEITAEEDGKVFHRGYLESLAVYRKIAEILPCFDGFLLHGVVVNVDGCGIAFLAKSGVGKTTHFRLWQQLLGDRISIVNGDKPLVRVKGGKAFAYGTPWAGKENMHKNTSVELKKICFIERSNANECIPLAKSTVFERLIMQIYRSKNPAHTLKTVDLVGALIGQADFFLIKCNTDISAAETAIEVIL